MKHPALDLLALAVEEFTFLSAPPLFFGGAVVPLYLGDEDCLDEARVTDDVDVVVEMVSETREGLDIELVRHGFVSDDSAGAPSCRWRRKGRRYDVLDAETLQANDWVRPGRGSYVEHRLGTQSVDPDGFRLMAYPHIPRARAEELLEGLGERLKRLTELVP